MRTFTTLLASLALLTATAALAGESKTYAVTVTNVTAGQTFTPLLVATHTADIGFFELGQPASHELGALAESGNIMPLRDVLDALPDHVQDTATNGALLGPGESVTIYVEGSNRFDRLSIAGMLIPTHDTFVSVNSMELPRFYGHATAAAYDAGTETNSELCDDIPGPYCGGEALSPGDDGEGYVHPANGIHGQGDLDPAVFDWRNPVATVSVRRMK